VLGLLLSFFGTFASLSSLSYALELREKADGARFRLAYYTLLAAAGLAMGGCGIWTMHFLGMSAEVLTTCNNIETDIQKRYNVKVTFCSLAVAIISSTVAVHFSLPRSRHNNQQAHGLNRVVSLSQIDNVRSRRKTKSGPEFWVRPYVKLRGRLVKIIKVDLLRFAASTACLALGALGMHFMVS